MFKYELSRENKLKTITNNNSLINQASDIKQLLQTFCKQYKVDEEVYNLLKQLLIK